MLIYPLTTPTLMMFAGSTGLAPGATISINGGPFGSSANSPADVGNGWYSLTLTSGETATSGPLAVHLSAGTPQDFLFQVGAVVGADVLAWRGETPNALSSGRVPVEVQAFAAQALNAAAIASDVVGKLFSTTALVESYAADGATATPAQLWYMLWSALSEFVIAGGTLSCKKLDGTTQAMAFALSPAGNPVARARTV